MAAAGALIGMIGGQTSSGLGTLYSGEQSRKAQKRSERFQREVMMNRIGWMVGDLKRAGLNPLLATGMQPGMASGGPYSGVSQASGAGATAGARVGVEVASAKAQIALAREMKNTENMKQSDYLANLGVKYEDAMLKRSQVDLNLMKQVESWEQSQYLRSSALNVDAMRRLTEEAIPSASAAADFYRTSRGEWAREIGLWRDALFGGGIPGYGRRGKSPQRGSSASEIQKYKSGKSRLKGAGGRPVGRRR